MNELSDWIQSNWYECGSLMAQFAIVALLAWYGRRALQMMGSERKTQTVESAPVTRSFAPRQAEPEAVGYGGDGRIFSEAPAPVASATAVAARNRSNQTDPWSAMVRWLRTPMNRKASTAVRTSEPFVAETPEPQPAGHAGVGRMLSPLPETAQQEEAVAYRYVRQSNPWKAMVRWMKTPMSGRQSVAWRRVTVRQ